MGDGIAPPTGVSSRHGGDGGRCRPRGCGRHPAAAAAAWRRRASSTTSAQHRVTSTNQHPAGVVIKKEHIVRLVRVVKGGKCDPKCSKRCRSCRVWSSSIRWWVVGGWSQTMSKLPHERRSRGGGDSRRRSPRSSSADTLPNGVCGCDKRAQACMGEYHAREKRGGGRGEGGREGERGKGRDNTCM